MARQCPACGTTQRDQAKFCDNCGLKLEHTRPDEATIRLPDTQPPGSPETVVLPGLDDAPEPDDAATVAIPGLAGPPDTAEEAPNTIRLPDTQPAGESTVPLPGLGDTTGDKATLTLPDLAKETAGPTPPPPAVAGLPSGQILQQRYRIERVLGKGGFGAVYLAQDVRLKRACVVKQMLIPARTPPHEIKLYQANFEREASLLVQLNQPGHPNIPEIYDYFSDAGGNYLVMKYIEGLSLQDVLADSGGKILWREAVRYAIDVCNALHYMHTIGQEPVMHRDIKPANILLGDDGRLWLVDFGLAKARPVKSAGSQMATQTAGSIGYSPLEQWLGEAVPASDVYALGATLHHLVTGVNPYDAYGGEFSLPKLLKLHGQFAPLRKIDRNLPKELDEIIRQATAPEPEQRPTALQLQQHLQALISGLQEIALFTFKSGEAAQTVNQLAALCEKYRPEAEDYLYNGDFERWFTIINRNDLADAARQAVKQSKNKKDGLEKFLKLIIPHLFLKRLGRASWRLTRASVQFILIFMLALWLIIIGGSYAAQWLIQRSIASYNWNYYTLDLNRENRFTESYLNTVARSATGAYFEDIQIDLRPPNLLDITANFGNILQLHLPVVLRHEDQKPHFYLSEINNIPMHLVLDNISQGINNGIDEMFRQAPIDVVDLQVQNRAVVFKIAKSGRVPWRPPPTPTATPIPTVTPTPEGLALIAIFNELDQDIILEVETQSWVIAAHDTKVIEKPPGTYKFTVKYVKNGQLAAQGTKTWDFKAYKWRINLNRQTQP